MIGLGRWFGVAVAGFALGWAFPPHGPWWLGPLAVAVFTLCMREQRTLAAGAMGFVFGMVFFTTLQTWMIVVGLDAWLLLSAICALWFIPVGIATAWVMRLRGWPTMAIGRRLASRGRKLLVVTRASVTVRA